MRAFKRRTDPAGLPPHLQATLTSENPQQSPVQETPASDISNLAPAQDSVSYSHLKPGQIIDAPLGRVKMNPKNARKIYSQARLDDMETKLRARGQQTAAKGFVDEDGNICLIDGHRRFKGCQQAAIPTLRIEIRPRPTTKAALYLESRSANTDQEAQTPLDDAFSWKESIEDGTFESAAELVRQLKEQDPNLKCDETMVSRTIGLCSLPKTIILMLSEKPALMNLRMLDAIRRYVDQAGEEEGERLILEIEQKELSSREVDKRRLALQNGPTTRKRSEHRTLKFEHGLATIKRFEGQGRLVVECTEVKDEEIVKRLEDKINAVIKAELAGSA